ncbi:MAG: transcription termination factor NusA [Clostridia bacterium]
MGTELLSAIRQIERERGIDAEILIVALEEALAAAYKKNYGKVNELSIRIDRETGETHVVIIKQVVEEVTEPGSEISLEEARIHDQDVEEGDCLQFDEELIPKNFGRIAAQTAKQVIMQKIREAERDKLYDIYDNKLKDIVTGIIRRIEHDNVFLDLGNTEAIMARKEQVNSEHYALNSRLKVYVTEVKKTNRGPRIYVSRTHPELVKRLFEMEVPEIQNGIVEIKAIAREPGSRTKIAVYSYDENVDASGACIGHRGIRVTAVVDELRGEKIDIVEWSSNIVEFINNSLSPADVIRVDMFEGDEESSAKARVAVPDNQLSLAIGKEGQNARLAARLTGWKIDIISESKLRGIVEEQLVDTKMISGNKGRNAMEELNSLFMDSTDSEEVVEDDIALDDQAEQVIDEETPAVAESLSQEDETGPEEGIAIADASLSENTDDETVEEKEEQAEE